MQKRVMVILAPGFEEIEAIGVIGILRRADVNVQICSTDKEYVTGKYNVTVKSDVRLEFIDIENDKYDMIYLPGGVPGVNHLAESDLVIKLLRKYYKDEVFIGAICAAPWVLDVAGILTDHDSTSHPTFRHKVNPREYKDAAYVRSGNVLTSRGVATTFEMGYQMLDVLGLKDKADQLKEEMQYNFLMEEARKK